MRFLGTESRCNVHRHRYLIIWTDVLTPTPPPRPPTNPWPSSAPSPSGGWGEHCTPRIDTSEHVWFANDQLAVRFIEEIDFDYFAPDATSVLMTPAS
jgi:hypothetical protein